MRKKTVNHLADTIFWYLLYFLPIIMSLLVLLGAFQGDWFNLWFELDGDLFSMPFFFVLRGILDNGFDVLADNLIIDSFNSIFGSEGILPLFLDITPIFSFFSYFIGVYLMHLMVDFILFIPRLCHKWMKSFTQGD